MPSEGPLCQREGGLFDPSDARPQTHPFSYEHLWQDFPSEKNICFSTDSSDKQLLRANPCSAPLPIHPQPSPLPPSFLVIAPFLCPSSICVRLRARARRGQEGYFPFSLSIPLIHFPHPPQPQYGAVRREGREYKHSGTAVERALSVSVIDDVSAVLLPSLPHYKSNTLPKYAWLSAVRSSVRPAPPKEGEREAAECVGDVGRSPVCLGRPPSRAERGAARRRRLRCWRRRCLTTKNSGAMDNAARA